MVYQERTLMRQRLLNILFWSILSAAFIGPGTVTTAASAGAEFGYGLLWALAFSVVACIVLQEASARLTLATGHSLGASIQNHFGGRPWGRVVTGTVVGSIILGCAAYEAGNILGAVEGVRLIYGGATTGYTLLSGLGAGLLLWFGTTRVVAHVLGVVVAFMGGCFLTTAILLDPPVMALLKGSIVPQFPEGSGVLILALIGTTVVPYNLFLGAGVSEGQTIREMRWSLPVAITLGGIVSLSVLVVGAAMADAFTFRALADQLTRQLGDGAAYLLGLGLYAAGFSSAITASMAAALTAKGLAEDGAEDPAWQEDGTKYRAVWGAVLVTGVGFGGAQVQPVPAILLAQALNGVILPVVAIYLLLMVNSAADLGPKQMNSPGANAIMGIVVFLSVVLGVTNLLKALNNLFAAPLVSSTIILSVSVGGAVLLAWPVGRAVVRLRRGEAAAPPLPDAEVSSRPESD
ncbi:MAG: Nramp family divalent metal transporter [Salinibacter sp.]